MDKSTFEDQIGFWNVAPPDGQWRVVACLRHGGSPGPKGESATVLSWDNAQARAHVASMLRLGSEAAPPDGVLSAAACSRALALCAVQASSHAFSSCWAEAAHSAPRRQSDSSTSRFIIFDEGDLVSMAAGLESLAASTGGSVRHSHDNLARAARDLAASRPAARLQPEIFCAPRLAINPQADLFWARDSHGREHRVDARALAWGLGLPLSSSLAHIFPDLGLEPHFLDMEALRGQFSSMGDQAFVMGCSVRFDPQSDGRRDAFAVCELQSIQEARMLAESIPLRPPSPRRSL